jgi:hypothetical protein
MATARGRLFIGSGMSLGDAVGRGPSGTVGRRKKHQMRAAE